MSILDTKYYMIYTKFMVSNWIQVFIWWYREFPGELARHQRLAILAIANFFSFKVLLKTLFQPWKKDRQSYSKKSIGQRVEILGMNTISRAFGFVFRGGAILVGILAIVFLIGLFAVLWVAWLFAPLAGLLMIILAFRELGLGGRND